ncbi:MAG: YfcE family phosphodiesterase, partial [Candidatus Bipolaricaulota bacterium]|nr:YfcE family phosphodiesterase [Candidatus Bipolaricaulota bacterium]
MKLGIISDTHDNMPKIARAVELFNERKVDLVLHAGDFISPITASEFTHLEAPLIGVFGNNDGERLYLTERFNGIGKLYPD